MRLAALILGLLIGAPWRCHAWTVKPYDCKSASAYVQSNAETLVTAVQSFFPRVSTQPTWVPDANVWGGLGYTGFGASVARLYVQLGASPAKVANVGLHLVCLSLEP